MNKGKDIYIGQIYDSLYKNKSYQSEVDKISSYIKGKSIIDIGGGSGGHSLVLKKMSFDTHIVDISPSMVEVAKKKGLNAEIGDFDFYTSEKKYDTAISLFHVMNFSKNLEKTFRNISSLLVADGVFIFDFWNSTVKKEGLSLRLEGRLTRFVNKKWKGDNVNISFFFPFLLKIESHMLYCPSKEIVLEQAEKAGFKVKHVADTALEYLFILNK